MYAKMLTKQMLCDAIYTVVFRSEKPLSRKDICDSIGKHKSPHIVAMIEHLSEQGYFKRETIVDHFQREVFMYTCNKNEQDKACSEVE